MGGGDWVVHLLERHVRGDGCHAAPHSQLSPPLLCHHHREHLPPHRQYDPQVCKTMMSLKSNRDFNSFFSPTMYSDTFSWRYLQFKQFRIV